MPAPPRVSFEFFPPKTEEAETRLWQTIRRLEPLSPSFVSVTYGAGGSTRDRTHRTVSRVIAETALRPAAHLTCIAATEAQLREVLEGYWAAGVRHIVALRGDPPEGVGAAFSRTEGGLANATDLTRLARQIAPFEVSVGVYPERHPESPSMEHDLKVLKEKVEAGATRGITQFFFDAEVYLRFRDRALAAGIFVPIVPGIMPVTNFRGLARMAAACGASIPAWLPPMFEGLDDDAETRGMVAATVATDMVERLRREGVEDFHFYTLNRAELTLALCRRLGVPLKNPAEAA
jgi:methylenetetrahydrofolate reductase (NADPH)